MHHGRGSSLSCIRGYFDCGCWAFRMVLDGSGAYGHLSVRSVLWWSRIISQSRSWILDMSFDCGCVLDGSRAYVHLCTLSTAVRSCHFYFTRFFDKFLSP